MDATQGRIAPKRRRAEFVYIDVRAFSRLVSDEPGIARHVARHTFCSRRVQLGFSYAHVAKLVGDTSPMVEKVYGHLSPEHLLKASNMDTSMLRAAA